jgi:hypothetical protein
LLAPAIKPAERQLIQMLAEAEGFREKLAREIVSSQLHRGLETEKIFEALISRAGEQPDAAALAGALDERDRQVLFEVLFEASPERTWEAAESCLSVLRNRRFERELLELQKQIEAKPSEEELRRLLARKQELHKFLAGL